MNQLRDAPLARAALAEQQHRRAIARREQLHLRREIAHHGRAAERERRRDAAATLAEILIELAQSNLLERPFRRDREVRAAPRASSESSPRRSAAPAPRAECRHGR